MPEKFASDYNNKPLHVGGYGNGWAEDYAITKAIASGDKCYFGIIPAGIRVYEVTAPSDLTMTFEPVEEAPAAGSFTGPITFDKPVKLVGTATAALASGAAVIVTGKVVGVA